ncbi:Cytochrome P450 [Melia azedarach]|uniref:Cytochrome P450 n=1 Tax=Melia azedarach TaxID=155640 RepID=A0ACC1YTQ7_MELAZ|nr:Cytochrome P450 [Melia azedarach]
MAALAAAPSTMSTISIPRGLPRSLKLVKLRSVINFASFSSVRVIHYPISCTELTPWESSPVKRAPTDDSNYEFLNKTSNIFETLSSDSTAETPITNTAGFTDANNQPLLQLQFLKWPMWLLGPALLLGTGMVPTLWLPISSIFLGPNIASLLSLIGLDCIFNIGATLFLLMADSCARPKNTAQTCNSKPPFSYQFWNMVANVTGFIIPLIMLFGSQKGFVQPQMPFIPFAVLLGPYLLLLSVQILTEMLTWHWQSPVWLVTPVVYESYRVLQLMRGLKLGAELSAPAWIVHTVRGLVCWWILILGVQLMRVAWFAGFTTRARQKMSSASTDGLYSLSSKNY